MTSTQLGTNPNAIQSAESLLVNFADTQAEVALKSASLAHLEITSIEPDSGNVLVAEQFTLTAADESGKLAKHYSAVGRMVVEHTAGSRDNQMVWEQELSGNRLRLARRGYVNKYDNKIDLTDNEGPEWHPILGSTDLFSIAICDFGAFQACRANRGMVGREFLRDSTPILASEDKTITTGVWKRGRALVSISFDSKSGNMPVRTSWHIAGSTDEIKSIKLARTYSATRTSWKKQPSDGEAVWCPIELLCTSQGVSQGSEFNELKVFAKWKIGENANNALPSPTDDDWREPVRKLFKETFTVGFAASRLKFLEAEERSGN